MYFYFYLGGQWGPHGQCMKAKNRGGDSSSPRFAGKKGLQVSLQEQVAKTRQIARGAGSPVRGDLFVERTSQRLFLSSVGAISPMGRPE